MTLTWDGKQSVPARPGETVTAALLCAGILATSRSLKFRRPRGPYCLRGDCGTCLVRIDGKPNQRACLTPVRDGMRVDPQNRLAVAGGPDPTGIADKMFGKQMDHHHFMVRPRMLNEIMKGIARNLAGLGHLPDAVDERPMLHEHHSPDVLVVGAGPAGLAAAAALRAAGKRCLVMERVPGRGGDDDLYGTGVFGIYADEGLVAAATLQLTERDLIHTVVPKDLLFATGARDSMVPMQGNDLPGVVSARGLAGLARDCGLQPLSCAVIGEGPVAQRLAEELHAPLLEQADEIEGSKEVAGVALGQRTVPCSLVALAPAPSAASEVARLGGATVTFDGAGFPLDRDASGRVAAGGPWRTWACGAVAGVFDRTAAAEDGRKVARAIVEAG